MANSQNGNDRYSYAVVDTAPGADGYWCGIVSMNFKGVQELFWSRSGGGVGTVTIQFLLPYEGATWQDLTTSENLVDGERFKLDGQGAGVKWRTGIKNAAYTSGTVIVGFDW